MEALNFGGQRPGMGFVVGIVVFVTVGVTLICAANHVVVGQERIWIKPSVSRFTLSASQPLQLFMLNGNVFLAFSVGSAFYSAVIKEDVWTWVFFLCVSVGCYLGVFVSSVLFRDRVKT